MALDDFERCVYFGTSSELVEAVDDFRWQLDTEHLTVLHTVNECLAVRAFARQADFDVFQSLRRQLF
jgi:hypothetical protein